MRIEVAPGIEIAYEIQGEDRGEGRNALLLHGFTGRGASWQGITPGLVASWRLILPDLLGHGASSAPESPIAYRMETAAAYLNSMLDQVAPGPVHLLGYSMGGRLALYYALAYPERVRSLVLESASPGLETEMERTARRAADEALAEKILSQGMEAFVKSWEALPLFASQSGLPVEVLHRQRQFRLANRPVGLAGSLRGMGTGAQPALWDRLGSLACPVLLLTGALDVKFLGISRRMSERIPDAEMAVILQAGHTTHLEQPELFIQRVRDFWERLPSDTDQPQS